MQNDTIKLTRKMRAAFSAHATYLASPVGSTAEKKAKARRKAALAALNKN